MTPGDLLALVGDGELVVGLHLRGFGQGPNWLYYALLKAEANSPKASDRLSKLYFYDFITGSLVSMVPRGAISVAPLLDPENIGTGMCSLLEMVGAGGETGDFACGRGISCSANNMNNVPNLGQGTELIPNNSVLGNAADNSFLGDRGQLFDNLGANFQGETTPYGIPVSSLSGNCEGAGTSAAGIGQLANSPGFSSFSGCLATALAAAAQDNTGSCIIRASQAIASQQPTTIFGTGRNGLPVVRGVLGDSSCQSDPLAQGGGKPLTSGQFASDCRTFYACGKEGAADFFRSQAGVEFTKQLLHDAADAWADRLGDINSIGSGSRTLTPDQQAAVDAAHDQADAEAGNLAEEGAKAVEDSKQKAGLASKEKDAGQTRGSDIVVDKGLPDTKSNQAVLEHEAAHAILNKFFTGKGGSSGVDHHEVMKQQPGTYYDRWAQMMEDAKSWIEEQLNPSKDEEEDTPPSDDQDQTQTPKPDEGYCTALSESMKTLMACTNPIEFPFEAPGGLSPETVILPERADGPTFLTPLPDDDGFAKSEAAAASMFGECYAQFGMNVLGVDKKGNLIIGGTADLSSNRCGALDCTPPSVAKPVNGFCQCVGDGPDIGRIYREMGHKRLCATSDACIPRIDIFSTLDNLLEPDPGF